MKKLNSFSRAIVAVLLFSTVFLLFTTVAFAEDYSKPGVANKEMLDAPDVLTEIFNLELSDIEREYLSLFSDYEIAYTAAVPGSLVEIKRNESENLFSVFAKPYSYTATNGKTVTFIPEFVEVLGESFSLEMQDDVFVATVPDNGYTDSDSANVIYKTYIEVDRKTANYLSSKTYSDAKLFSEYNEKSEAYDKYLIELSRYEDYLSEKARYEREEARYNDYIDELSTYGDELKAYEDYLVAVVEFEKNYSEYVEDQKTVNNYDTLYAKYLDYSDKIAKVRSQIAILDGLKNKSTSLSRSVYSAVLIGNVVTQVITNKELIANEVVGASKDDVDNAGRATDNLRSLCLPYFDLTGEMEKYCYYILYYEEIHDNFTTLWISLDNLYKNAKIRTVIADMDMREKYEILLGQLCYVTMALNGGPVGDYSPNYVINQRAGTTVLSVLEGVPYMSYDADPTPIDAYPDEVKEPIVLNIPEPIRPKEVKEPVEPELVLPPKNKPDPVDKPVKVKSPGEPPENYLDNPLLDELISAYREGALVKREEISSVGVFEISATVSKNLHGAVNEHTVVFFDENKNELYRTKVDEGGYVDFDGTLPQKAETPSASYTFVGWMDADGNECDITSVNSYLELYPIFKETLKTYRIGWSIDGNTVYTTAYYGDTPTCPIEPSKSDSENFEYIFKGWNIPITEVRADVTYVAIFAASPLYENGEVSRDENGFTVNIDSGDSSFLLDKLMTRVNKNEFITVNTSNCTLTLSPEAIALMKEYGYTGLGVDVVRLRTDGGYKITVKALDARGGRADIPAAALEHIRVDMTRELSFVENDSVTFFYLDGQSRVIVRSSYTAGALSASFEVGRTYYAIVEYPAHVFSNEYLSIAVSSEGQNNSYAQSGETVTVLLSDILDGVEIDGVYYLDSENRRFEIEKDTDGAYRFKMIRGGVSIGVDAHIRTYKIVFTVDGVVFNELTVSHGSFAPTLSAAKKSDGTYSYDFCGWATDSSFGVVDLSKTPITSDVTFSAVFSPTRIVHPEVDRWRTPAKLFLVVFYALIVFLPTVCIITSKAVKRARR